MSEPSEAADDFMVAVADTQCVHTGEFALLRCLRCIAALFDAHVARVTEGLQARGVEHCAKHLADLVIAWRERDEARALLGNCQIILPSYDPDKYMFCGKPRPCEMHDREEEKEAARG